MENPPETPNQHLRHDGAVTVACLVVAATTVRLLLRFRPLASAAGVARAAGLRGYRRLRPVASPLVVAYLLYRFRFRGAPASADQADGSLLELLVRWAAWTRTQADLSLRDLLLTVNAGATLPPPTQPWFLSTAAGALCASQRIIRPALALVEIVLPHAWRLAENLVGIRVAAGVVRASLAGLGVAARPFRLLFGREPPVAAASLAFKALVDAGIRIAFDFVRFHVPGVQAYLDRQSFRLLKESEDSTFRKDPNRTVLRSLPEEPVPESILLHELEGCSASENVRWKQGRVSGTVYVDESTANRQSELASAVYRLYAYGNPLHPGFWPRMNQSEAEVIQMCGSLLHAPGDPMSGGSSPGAAADAMGCVTSGGTESILLAVRAHVAHYGIRRGIARPEIVCGSTAHAALHKAAEMYGVRLVTVDCNACRRESRGRAARDTPQAAFQLDPEIVRDRITANTVMIYASAPSYPQGVVDPMGELSDLALEYDVGLHVDACLGGFVLAFLSSSSPKSREGKELHPSENEADKKDSALRAQWPNVPIFDFRNAGVTSMSIDPHKYGCASKGSSVVLYRSRELRHGQYFTYPHWTGGMYATPTFAGSRPGALSVCAWAAMLSIGHRGYRDHAHRIVSASRRIASGIAGMSALRLLTPLDQVSVVVCFGSADPSALDIYRVSDSMSSMGWALNELQNPASIHICVTLNLCGEQASEDFLRDLRTAVAQVQSEGPAGRSKGTAGIYGAEISSCLVVARLVASLPEGPIECVLHAFTDLSLAP